MKKIPLTKGMEALVDDQDYKFLMQWDWQYHSTDNGGYAVRTIRNPTKKIWMHHVVATRKGLVIKSCCDHIDRNGVNNRRDNLRLATSSQNGANRFRKNKSGFRGVYWYPRYSKWSTQIRVEGKLHNLGYFTDKIEAAKAYNKAAEEHFGEFAWLNPIPED